MNTDGSDRKRITTGKPDKFYPVQSRDGRYIVYMSDKLEIWQMESGGSNSRRISVGTKKVRFPRLSPDSEWLVYSTYGGDQQDLLKVTLDGEKEVPLASHKFIVAAAVSPEGNRIAYLYNDSQISGELSMNIISSDGGVPLKRLKLVRSSWLGGRVHWTPDGRGIAYIRDNEKSVSNIYVQPIDGSPARRLTNFTADQVFNFSWSLDGKQIAYSRGKGTHDIVLIQSLP
jgi:Tol biopolymer transport system component